MSEENNIPPQGTETSSTNTSSTNSDYSWQEVGRQFQALGETLAQTIRSAWQSEETQKRVEEMRTGLQSMAQEIGRAVEDTANSPQGQKIRSEAKHTAESLRVATEQTIQEVRPQLINALQEANSELQKLIDKMQAPPPSNPPSSGPTNPPEQTL